MLHFLHRWALPMMKQCCMGDAPMVDEPLDAHTDAKLFPEELATTELSVVALPDQPVDAIATAPRRGRKEGATTQKRLAVKNVAIARAYEAGKAPSENLV